MQLFYSSQVNGQEILLDEEESRHATQVLRKKQGDLLNIIDGKGTLYTAGIVEAGKKTVKLKITSSEVFPLRKQRIHIAIAPTKNMDRTEWFLEKCVEMGVEEISFLLCEHSERQVLKLDRLEKLIVSACKQAKQFYFPRLNGLQRFRDFVSDVHVPGKFICTCENQELLLHRSLVLPPAIVVMIGPEGDFSKEEIALAGEQGFKTLSLGSSRLRTETAGVVACSLFNFLLSD